MNSKSIFPAQLRRHLYSAFIGDLALPIFYTFLPLLAARLGANPLEIGVVGGANYAVYTFMPFIMGRMTDRIKSNNIFIIVAFSILATVSFLYSIVPTPLALIIARIFEGIGWAMLWPAIQSGVVQTGSLPSKLALSVYNFTWSGAAAIAPIVGAVLVVFLSIQLAFQLTAVALTSAIIVNLVPRFSRRNTIQNEVAGGTNTSDDSYASSKTIAHNISLLAQSTNEIKNPTITHGFGYNKKWLYVLALSCAAISNAVILTFFAPFAESIRVSVLSIGSIVLTYGSVRFCFYYLLTKERVINMVYDYSRRNTRILIALAAASLSNLLFMFADTILVLYFVLFAIEGVSYSLNNALCQVILVAEAPKEKLGTGAGTYESSVGIGAFLGPILAGMISQGSLIRPFLLPILCYLPVLSIFVFLGRLKHIRI